NQQVEKDEYNDCMFELEMENKIDNNYTAKLDAIMSLLYSYLYNNKEGKQMDEIFNSLIQLFDKEIIPTYQLHYVQFLMFYVCSFKQAYVTQFLKYLFQRTKDMNSHTELRQSCVSYIGGILSRANYISTVTLKRTLLAFSEKIIAYIQ